MFRLIVISALAMSLGWGWRGYIGGGPFGAMIPGAMVALVLCRLLGLDAARSGLMAAFGALGVGFGGEMTYGQTVGFIREPETFLRGLAGLSLKGGVWGLLGGAVLGVGFHRASSGRQVVLLPALIGFLIAVAAGWALINRPKLIYFSNLADRPREEVWAGLLLGAAALLLVYARTNAETAPVFRFGLAGSFGGFVGFGAGGMWNFVGAQAETAPDWIPWWKLMEFTFGALFGAALGWAAWRSRDRIAPAAELEEAPPPRAAIPTTAALYAVTAAAVFILEPFLPFRFNYAVIGALLLVAAAYVPNSRWWIALAITAAGFCLDWFDYVIDEPPLGSVRLGGAITAAGLLAFCAVTAALKKHGRLNARTAFWTLVTGAFVTSWGRPLLFDDFSAGAMAEHVCFLALLLAVVWTLDRPSREV